MLILPDEPTLIPPEEPELVVLDDGTELEPEYPLVKGFKTIHAPRGKAGEYAAWAIDPYRGCGYMCIFCYVIRQLAMGYATRYPHLTWPQCMHAAMKEFRAGAKVQDNFRDEFLHDVKKVGLMGVFVQIFMSFMADVYHLGDTDVTRWVMEMIRLHAPKAGFAVLTKAGMRSLRDIDLFDPLLDSYGFTLVSLNEDYIRKWEGRTDTAANRLKAAEAFAKRGIHVHVSIEPAVNLKDAIEVIKRVAGIADLVKLGPMSTIGNNLKELRETDAEWRPLTRAEHQELVLEAIAQCDKQGTDLYVKEDLSWAVPESRKARNKAMMRAKQRR